MPALNTGGLIPRRGNPLCTRVYMTPGENWTPGQLLVQVGDSPSVALMDTATLETIPTNVYVSPVSVAGHATKSLEQPAYRIDDPNVIWAAQIVTDALTVTGVQELRGQSFDLIPSTGGQALLDTAFSTSQHCRLLEIDADYLDNQGTWESGTAQWIVNVQFTPTFTKL